MALSSQYSSPGLEVWFRDDIQNTLRSVDSANAELFKAINTPEMQHFRQGYEAALRAIGEAFGIRYRPANHQEEAPEIIDVSAY
jgi:hypothetical protein